MIDGPIGCKNVDALILLHHHFLLSYAHFPVNLRRRGFYRSHNSSALEVTALICFSSLPWPAIRTGGSKHHSMALVFFLFSLSLLSFSGKSMAVTQVEKAVDSLYSEFRAVDNLVARNSARVLKAFQNVRVGSHVSSGFSWVTQLGLLWLMYCDWICYLLRVWSEFNCVDFLGHRCLLTLGSWNHFVACWGFLRA